MTTTPAYYKLANSIVIRLSGKTYTLHNSDHRYPKVIEAIEKKEFNDFEALLDPTKVLGEEGFTVVNGVIHYKDHPIPTILGDQFLEYKIDKVSFMGLVNFWMNLKNRTDFEHSYEHIITLLQQKGYPVTEDGFIIAYKQDEYAQKEVRFDTRKEIVTPFFNYGKASPVIRQMFDDKLTLNQMAEKIFGFSTKKLIKLLTEKVFPKGSPYIAEGVFNLGIAFKDILSPNNLFEVLEKGMYPCNYGNSQAHSLMNEFWKEFGKTKEGKISEKRILNLLTTKYRGDQLLDLGSFWDTLKNKNLNLDLQAANFTADVEAIHKYLDHEVKKLKNPEIELHMEAHYPKALNIVGNSINELDVLIPKTNYDLVEWSQKLSNCLHSYPTRVKAGEVAIVGFCDKKGKMVYSLEIINGVVTQFRSKHNNAPHEADFKPILDFLFDKGITHTVKCSDGVCNELKKKFPGY